MAQERCFAFVDLAGYTALTEAHGDEGAATIASRFYELARAATDGDTRIVKRIGDAVMLVGTDAADCACAVVRMFERAGAEEDFLGLRAGLYAGAAVERDGDYFGTAVNLAARIAAHARAGEILCGTTVAREAGRSSDLRFVPAGTVALKNVKDAIELYSVVIPGGVSTLVAIDPVCRMRVPRDAHTVVHDGVSYSFCSTRCAAEFERSPDGYVDTKR